MKRKRSPAHAANRKREAFIKRAGSGASTALQIFSWSAAITLFLIGLLCRASALDGPHDEGDEIVYQTLVQQLEVGKGYTLQGTPLIGKNYPAEQYGRPLFFHPPGGVALFWILHRLFGPVGYPLTNMLSYTIFFWSMVLLSSIVLTPFRGPRILLVTTLAAFTPIMTHVTSRYWIDGPLLAFSTAASALFLFGIKCASTRCVALAGLLLGYASLIKVTAFLILPGLLLMVWLGDGKESDGTITRLGILFIIVAALIQLPWEIWQWIVLGSPFPAWAGKPTLEVVETNPYVSYLTVQRPPWIYVVLMPRVLWTLLPSLAGLLVMRLDSRIRRIGAALVGWVLVVLGAHILLGYIGYSKVLRYAILVTPATVLLFGMIASELAERLKSPDLSGGSKLITLMLVILLALGLALEISQGVMTPLLPDDIIRPLW